MQRKPNRLVFAGQPKPPELASNGEELAVVGASAGVVLFAAAVNLAFIGGLVYIGYRLAK